ncbi:ferredoxin [Saccharopolyspora shandongensis]|uniref:ferredoxin n=1 Tax=Saccharopolyspora shandongensis TaxID=418495 RepID=UPI0033EC8AFF
MKVQIDTAKCQGHGRCYSLAPALFDADEEGFGVVRPDTPQTALEDARLAADNCPEFAVQITHA